MNVLQPSKYESCHALSADQRWRILERFPARGEAVKEREV